jgi:glyoxylase-like metal-dependent hydrolase (beta-lactamase superfamily II)
MYSSMAILRKTRGHILEQINDLLWRVEFFWPAPVNVWFYREKDGLALIDAAQPWNAPTIIEAAEIIGLPLKSVLITHAHPDHAGAAAALVRETGATVYVHKDDACFLQGNACMADAPGSYACRTLLTAGRHLRILNPPVVDRLEVVDDGDCPGTLRVMHTPGHTPGSISFWSESEGLLFCGDNIASRRNVLQLNTTIFTLNSTALRQSLEKYRELPMRMLLPGHGPAYGPGSCQQDVCKLL